MHNEPDFVTYHQWNSICSSSREPGTLSNKLWPFLGFLLCIQGDIVSLTCINLVGVVALVAT